MGRSVGDELARERALAEVDGRRRPRKPYVKFSAELARVIARRVALGEPVVAICAEPGMPTHGTVSKWARERGRFARSLRRAKEAAGWTTGMHPGPKYCEAQAVEIYARLCEGESLKSICLDPAMPGHSTVYRWRERFPEFAAMLRAAREVQAERFCDAGWEIASAVTPQTAYAAHVQLAHLRWTAGVLSPKRFGRFKAVTWEDEAGVGAGGGDGEPNEVVFRFRHFENVIGADGKAYVREVPKAPPGMALSDGSSAPRAAD